MASTSQGGKSDVPNAGPLAAWFLGPRAENADTWQELLSYIFQDYVHWRRNYFPTDPVVLTRVRRRSDAHESWNDQLLASLDFILNELKRHFPFHSPRYIAHMLSEQTLPSVLGYFAGMLFNPNNVTDEAAPITVELELEVGRMIAEMIGYPKKSWAHICSGGTVANLEALWVARISQFVPFVVRDFCKQENLPFPIKTANGIDAEITSVEDTRLISIRPNEAIFMLRKLAAFIHKRNRQPVHEILETINAYYQNNRFNVARRGIHTVLGALGLSPVFFVSSAAHYSIKKAANVLGYGEDTVQMVPVNSRFQLNMASLEEMLFNLNPKQYVAAVIGIVGTTEEGAVDPLHRIRFLRDDYEKKNDRSFWLHADAAWGGYIASLFRGLGIKRAQSGTGLERVCDEYVRTLQIEERFTIDFGVKHQDVRSETIRWAEREIYSSFLAMSDFDSTTVDPHKMGFVPYPAGVVAFRNGLVTDLILQRAQYISDRAGGVRSIDDPGDIDAVGPYILEGSKPGAAALSCWLAHKTIPLVAHGHGKIMRTTLLNSKKLFKYIVNHKYLFRKIHLEIAGTDDCVQPFTFVPFCEPDTNILCFIARPMVWQGDKLVDMDFRVQWLNYLNEKVYLASSIDNKAPQRTGSMGQPFFVSRTRFEQSQYGLESIGDALDRNGIIGDEYVQHGLFVLRSVVMNPWHFEASQAGMDYLHEFIKFLHKVTCDAIESTFREIRRTSPVRNQR